MPELPEVQSIINDLEKVLKGKIMQSVDCYYPGTVIADEPLKANPFPARVWDIKRRGKYIIILLDIFIFRHIIIIYQSLSTILHSRIYSKL